MTKSPNDQSEPPAGDEQGTDWIYDHVPADWPADAPFIQVWSGGSDAPPYTRDGDAP